MRIRLFLPVVLAVLLVVSSVQNVFAVTEIAYDEGPPETGVAAELVGRYLAVRFSLPSGLSSDRLVKARFYKAPGQIGTTVKVHVLGSNELTELTTPFIFDIATAEAWNDASLSVVVSGDFYIAIEYLKDMDPVIGTSGPPQGRSYHGTPGSWSLEDEALMIRAVLQSPTVGGVVLPVNGLRALAPYLVMIGLVAVAATVYVTKHK